MSLTNTDHQFRHPELSYDAEPNIQPAIKVTILLKKHDDISYEEFYKYWPTVHADLALSSQSFRDLVIRYVQYSHTPEMKQLGQSIGAHTSEYDGCAEIWVRTLDDWVTLYKSQDFRNSLREDGQKLTQSPRVFMIGKENLIIGDSSKDIGGKDGISSRGMAGHAGIPSSSFLAFF